MANDEMQQPDTSEPSDERKAELEAAYEKQKDTAAPYRGVRIQTLGELEWLMQQRHWSGDYDLPQSVQRPSLSGVNLKGINLRGARLRGADLHAADLQGTNLSDSHFRGARLDEANLENANLSGASMPSVNLTQANLRGADLRRVLFNAETVLDGIKIDPNTSILGVRWNGAPLDAVSWRDAPRFGDENDLAVKKKAGDRAQSYRNAFRAYHGLSVALSEQGLIYPASLYRLREMILRGKAHRDNHYYGAWVFYLILGAVAGYGEKPGRTFVAYLSIVTFFALIFWYVTNFLQTGSPPLQWYEAAVLSVSSFHGRGFFTNTIQLGDPLAIVAAFEAVCGLFIELVFIATFSRRFLGD